MPGTEMIVDFMKHTKIALDVLNNQLANVRYDLCGTIHRKEPESASASLTPQQNPNDMSLFDAVEYLAGGINESLNKMEAELQHLSERINHKTPPLSPPPSTPNMKSQY